MADQLVSMKKSKAEVKKDSKPMAMDNEQYPWGLQINLDSDDLKKLGIDKLPGVGDSMSFDIKCKVRSVSASEYEGSDKNQNVSMQITDMCVEDMDEAPDPVAKGSRIV